MREEYSKISLQAYDDKPLREQVLLSLRQAILTGKLKPGQRLMEMHLAEIMGVSRTPVREAIHKLELEGLVVMEPHHGVYVSRISEDDLVDALEVRRALEGLAVSRATQRISKEGIEELKKAMLQFEKISENAKSKKNNYSDVAMADAHFHQVIINATANRKLESIIENLSDQLFRYRFEYLKNEENYPIIIEEHREIYDAISKMEEDRAVYAMQAHIDRQAERILENLNNDRKYQIMGNNKKKKRHV